MISSHDLRGKTRKNASCKDEHDSFLGKNPSRSFFPFDAKNASMLIYIMRHNDFKTAVSSNDAGSPKMTQN